MKLWIGRGGWLVKWLGVVMLALGCAGFAVAQGTATKKTKSAASAPPAGGAVAPPAANSTNWTFIGPRPTRTNTDLGFVTGRVTAIAVDPNNADTVYIGGAQGGVWKSTDAGATWTALGDTQASLAIGALAIDPTNSNVIYAGTGEQTNTARSYYGAGVLKSTDAGATWTQLGAAAFVGPFSSGFAPGGGARISSIAIHPTNTSLLLAGVWITAGPTSGIYCSDDAGATWRNILPGAAGSEVFFDRQSPNIAYAALGSTNGDSDNGVYRSTSANLPCAQQVGTWARVDTGASRLPTTDVGRIEIAQAPTSTGTGAVLYAGLENRVSNGLMGFFRSNDGGLNWAQLAATPDYCTPRCGIAHTIAVHPNDANVVFAGGSTGANYFVRTTNAGASWAAAQTGANSTRLAPEVHAMAIANLPGGAVRIYAGTNGGVWRADLAAASDAPNWTNLNGDGVDPNKSPGITQFTFGPAVHPVTPTITYAGTQGNGFQKFNNDLTWDRIGPCTEGGHAAIDPDTPTTVYISCQDINIFKSTDSGGTFVVADAGIPNERAAFLPPLVFDRNANITPFTSRPLYYGTFRVWQSTNGAATWTAISPDLTSGGNDTEITSIAVAPSDSRVVYATTLEGRVWRTTNADAGASATWTQLNTPSLPGRVAMWIDVSPASANTAYVAYAGFSGIAGDTRGHVFKTTDGGATWVDISVAPISINALPNSPANVIVVDPDVAGTLYVGTDAGVFVSSDDGVNWTALGSGLPRAAVTGLVLHRPSRILRASTMGRGMWDLQLTNFTPPFQVAGITPTSVGAGSGDVTLTVNGSGFTSNSVVRFNTTDLTGSCASATQCTATIPASLLAAAGTAQITVFEPSAPAPGTSNAVTFTITGATPTLSSISPSRTAPGSADFTLTLTGTNFNSTSQVLWNGVPRPTTLVSDTQLTAAISAADVATTAIVLVSVQNPPPGGGTSNNRTFSIGTPPPNDDVANATVVSPVPFTNTVNNIGATIEATDPSPPCAPGSTTHSVWYVFTPTSNLNNVLVSTLGSAYDTVLSAWTGAPGSFTPFACDDDSVGAAGQSQFTVNLTAGTTYYFMVSGFISSQAGVTVFNLSATLVDISVTLTDSPDPVNAGANLTYTATVSNAGPTSANNVTLNYTLPPNVNFVSGSFSGGACANAAGVVTCTLPSLAAGANQAVTIVVSPTVNAAVTLDATMTVGFAGDANGANNTATTSTAVNVPAPDLSLALTDSPDPVDVGSNVTYTATVTNAGPATATNVTLTYTLQANVTLISATTNSGACANANGTVTCTFASLAAGNQAATIIVRPGAAGALDATMTLNFASDPNMANNSATASTTVNAVVPDVSVTLADSPDPVNVGSDLTYTATITNPGPAAVANLALAYTLPANVTFVSGTVAGGTCANASGTITCTISSAAAGTHTVTLVVRPGAAGTLDASVAVTPSDGNAANNSATTTTTVNQAPDFTATANPSTLTVARGQSGSTTITLTAAGGLSGATTFSCTGLPTGAACTFNPATVTLGAQPVTTTLTVSTTAGGMMAPPQTAPRRMQPPMWLPFALLALAMVPLLAAARSKQPRLRTAFTLAGLLLLASGLSACGGGDSSGTPLVPNAQATPPGTSQVAVRATSGSVTKTVPITLVVQ